MDYAKMVKVAGYGGLAGYRKMINEADAFEIAFGKDSYQWIHAKLEMIAKRESIPMRQVAGVYAVLSPVVGWMDCMRAAEALITSRGRTSGPGYGTNYAKARRIVVDGDLSLISGPKVLPFYKTLLDPEADEVVVDMHMVSAYLGVWSYSGRVKRMHFSKKLFAKITAAVRQLAKERGWPVTRTQATIWIVWKRITRGGGQQLPIWHGAGKELDIFSLRKRP